VEADGLPNLHKVTDKIYRSAQPSAKGFPEAERMGIKTVLNLRDFNDDAKEAEGTKLRLVTVDMNAWRIKDEDMALALSMLRDKKRTPVLVHCHHGADRTGVLIAMHRIVDQGWTREEAIKEMKKGGYGFHRVWINIVSYVEKADIEKIRARVDAIAAGGE
jgi:protein tyrosine/serine phosphatase